MPKKIKMVLRPDQLAMIEQQVDMVQAAAMQFVTTMIQVYGFSDEQVKDLMRWAEALEKWHEKLVERQAKVKPPKPPKPEEEEKPDEEPPEVEAPGGVVVDVQE